MAFALFKGAVANGVTKYVGVPIVDGRVGVHIGWLDATSAATITLELGSAPATDAPIDEAGEAWQWKDSGGVIAGPAGAAAGLTLVNRDAVYQKRARLKIAATADCDLAIWNGLAAG